MTKDRKALETGTALEADQRRAAQIEADRLSELNSRLSKDESAVAAHHKDNLIEAQRLSDRIDVVNRQITDIQAIKRQKELEIDTAVDTRKKTQQDLDNYVASNGDLQDSNKELRLRAADAGAQVDRLGQRLTDTLAMRAARDKDLSSAKADLAAAERRAAETRDEVTKFQRDNSVLQSLLDKYRGDANVQKRLREDEMAKKLAAEQEKKQLEREVLNKDFEARSAKKELERVQEAHEQLLDGHYQLNQELGALRGHAELLETQNKTVSSL